MKKSPIGNIREAVRRKSVGLSFTTNFSIFGRSTSSGGEEDRPGDGDGDEDEEQGEVARYNRSREDSAPRDNDQEASSPAVGSRNSYVEPPEPPLPPPGGLIEAATVNVQGKMKSMMETFHEVTTSIVRTVASLCGSQGREEY